MNDVDGQQQVENETSRERKINAKYVKIYDMLGLFSVQFKLDKVNVTNIQNVKNVNVNVQNAST